MSHVPLSRHRRSYICLVAACLVLSGCGGSGGVEGGGSSVALFDSTGKSVNLSRALPANHGISAAVSGLGPHDQAAFLFSGPGGAAQHPPYGLPACSFYSIFSADKQGSLPSQLISPRLPAGSYQLSIYDLKPTGKARQTSLRATVNLTVADSPSGVPSLDVGKVAAGAFTTTGTFAPGNDVYVRGSGFQAGQTVDIYVTAHKESWSPGDSLIDVSGAVPNQPPSIPAGTRATSVRPGPGRSRALTGLPKTVTADANGRFGPILAWQAIDAQADKQQFDIVVDAERSAQFTPAQDFMVDQATGAFVVDSVSRAGGTNQAQLAYNQRMVPARSFQQLDNVRTKLSERGVSAASDPIAEVAVCRHQAVWKTGDPITDVSGPDNSDNPTYIPIHNNRLVIPPMYAYHADLAPGDYDIVIVVGSSGKFDSTRDYIDGGSSGPAFTVGGGPAHKKWTVMVYVDGDNNLDPNAVINIKEMESVTYKDSTGNSDVNVVVQYADRNADTNRYIVAHTTDPNNITTNPLQHLGTVNMADPNQLSQFIAWAKQVSPADHYALILWDHGSGFTSRAARTGRTRNAIWADSFSYQSLTVEQIHDVLRQTGPFDLVAFDCCLMGMTEVAYELRDICKTFNGSEELEPGHGYDYKAFLSALVAKPGMTSAELGAAIVDAYKAYYTAHPDPKTGPTCASIDETQIAGAATAMNAVVTALSAASGNPAKSLLDSPTNRGAIRALSVRMFDKPDHMYGDAQDWLNQLKSLNFSNDVNSACDAAIAAYGKAVVAEWHAASQTGAHGLTIWLPDRPNYNASANEFHDLQFSKDTQWLALWTVLLNSGSTITPTAPTVAPDASELFTGAPETAPPNGTSVSYSWSTSGKYGTISDTKGHSGTKFTSTDSQVRYRPNVGAGNGADSVTVNVVLISGNIKVDLGPAAANVTVLPPGTITEPATVVKWIYHWPDGRFTPMGFYVFNAVPGAKSYTVHVDGIGDYGPLAKSNIDAGAPVIDRTSPPNVNTLVSFPNGGNFYNMGGGQYGLNVYPAGPITSYKYNPDQLAFQTDALNQATSYTAHVTVVK